MAAFETFFSPATEVDRVQRTRTDRTVSTINMNTKHQKRHISPFMSASWMNLRKVIIASLVVFIALSTSSEAFLQASRSSSVATTAAATGAGATRLAGLATSHAHLQQASKYFGSSVGPLTGRLAHNTSGFVFAVDEQTLFIRGFTFDGQAADTYFWSSTQSGRPSSQDAFIVPDEKGSTKPLERYDSKDVVLRLPEGKTLREINWLSIWSRQAQTSLAEIYISRQLVIPRPLEIGPLSELAHGLRSGPITIVDAQTFLVPDFHYDGQAPAAYFWLTRGSQGLQEMNGFRLKDENGSSNVLKKYQGETLVISLPDELTIYDFDFFGVWCRQFKQNFGQVRIPQQAKVPPSPKMLGIKPENKLNCEILYDDLGYEIRWVLDGDDIVMQLVGKIEPGEYMAFGLGKDDSKSEMQNADAVAAWVDRQTGQVHAHDYFLGGKAQCVNDPKGGSCPDTKLPGGGDSLTLLHGAIVNGYSMVTFKRPQLGVDEQYDQHVYSDGQQSVLWAIGTLNAKQEIGYHRLRTKSSMFIDFARNPQWNCPIPDLNATLYTAQNNASPAPPISSAASHVDPQFVGQPDSAAAPAEVASEHELQNNVRQNLQQAPTQSRVSPLTSSSVNIGAPAEHQITTGGGFKPTMSSKIIATRNAISASNGTEPWFVPSIVCPTDRTLHAQIGPTGGKRGFEGLTGQQAHWGISWYINGILIPELVLERGQSYRFVVEGGNDKTSASARHPLYLTDSWEGGYEFKLDEERAKERIFGGVALRGDGQYVPTAEGRLCEWKQTKATNPNPDLYPSFAAYQKSLKLECSPGQASILKFTPDADTPDLIYYQCYSYRQMGWRIRLVNSCQNYLQQQQMARSSPHTNNNNKNNLKRDTQKDQRSEHGLSPSKFNRRSAVASGQTPTTYVASTGDQYDAYNRNPFDTTQTDETFRLADFTNHQAFQQQQQQNQNNNALQFLQQQQSQQLAAISGNNDNRMTIQQQQDGDLKNFPDDLLIVNAAQLMQRQPLNLSNYEQILKLAPSDLEILDVNENPTGASMASEQTVNSADDPATSTFPRPQQSDQLSLTAGTSLADQLSMNLNNVQLSQLFSSALWPKFNLTQQQSASSKQNKTRTPKGLQVYIKRLASIYYPVQQQLASITIPFGRQSNNTNAQAKAVAQQQQSQSIQQQALQAALADQQTPQASTSSFSLYNFMPKPKIDLSKSGISKKLNKLRFKGGWRAESSSPVATQQLANKPPTPQNEFNYDIFNNQLAQLEKQQQQLQSLESMALAANMNWPQQTNPSNVNANGNVPQLTSGGTLNQATFGYLPNLQAAMDQANQISQAQANHESQQQNQIEDQQAIDSINQQTYPMFKPSSNVNHNHQQEYENSQIMAASLNGQNNWLNQFQELTADPSITQSNISNAAVMSPSKMNWASVFAAADQQQQNQQLLSMLSQPQNQETRQQQQQQSIFITRLHPSASLQHQQQHKKSFTGEDQLSSANTRFQTPMGGNQYYWQNVPQNVNSLYTSSAQGQSSPQHSQFMREESPIFSAPTSMQFNPTSGQPQASSSMRHNEFSNGNMNGQVPSFTQDELESLSSGALYYQQQATTTSELNNNNNNGRQFQSGITATPTVGSKFGPLIEEPIASQSQQQQHSPDSDHMLAIERFSKQPSERQPPAIVHPITGDQVLMNNNNNNKIASHQQNQQNQQQNDTAVSNGPPSGLNSRRFQQSRQQQMLSSSPPPPISSTLTNEILDVEQSMRTSDLRRVNLTEMNSILRNEVESPRSSTATSTTNPTSSATTATTTQSPSGCNAQASCVHQLKQGIEASPKYPQQNQQQHHHYHHHHHHNQQQHQHENSEQQQNLDSNQQPMTSYTQELLLGEQQQNNYETNSINQQKQLVMSPQFQQELTNQHQQQPIAHRSKELEETIFRSNLIEPISSTLVPPFATGSASSQADDGKLHPSSSLNDFRFDPVPFTPIEITSTGQMPFFAASQPEQVTQAATPGLRLRSTSQNQQHLGHAQHEQRSADLMPPNKVASYLASRLLGLTTNNNNNLQQSGQLMQASSALSPTIATNSFMSSTSQFPFQRDENERSQNHHIISNTYSSQQNDTYRGQSNVLRLPPPASELIILKPAPATSSRDQSMTNEFGNQYLLRPEYMLTSNANQDQDAESLLYGSKSNEINADRLSAHQFDRLSSLSSPPTTSIMVDPLQAANTIMSFTKDTNNNNNSGNQPAINKNINNNNNSSETMQAGSSTQIGASSNVNLSGKQANSSSGTNSDANNSQQVFVNPQTTSLIDSNNSNDKLAQHRKIILASKQQILTNNFDSSQLLGDLEIRLNPGGESALNSVLRADNKTDNAILSHVMSLISSNALPNGPHIFPLGPYSRADYLGPPSFARTLFGRN